MAVKVIYKREDWESVATCIRTEQVPAEDIMAIFNDNPEFKTWYEQEYINDND